MSRFLSELRRRRVIRTGAVYMVAGWAVMQVSDLMFPRLALPDWSVSLVVALVVLGFPVAVALAWAFDVTPEGVVRTGVPAAGTAPPPESPTAPVPSGGASAETSMVAAPAPPAEAAPRVVGDDRPSIAVLPFANLSPDPDNAYFADGLTEEIIADLSCIRALRVISRTSVMCFKDADRDLRSIARTLGVKYVLEGSVRRAGNDLRVTAQLIEAETDSHLWAEKYSGTMEDVFAIQEKVSRKIVNALEVNLTAVEEREISARPIEDPVAYECYLRARHAMFIFTPDSLDRAQKFVDDARAVIGDNPLLLATKGLVAWYFVNGSVRPDSRYLQEAAEYAKRALALDPRYPLGVFLRGLVAAKHGDMAAALRDMRAAHELSPGDVTILAELCRHLYAAGHEHSEFARTIFEQMGAADPLTPLFWGPVASRHFTAGRLEESEHAARRMLDLSERGHPARFYASWYLALLGLNAEAIRLLRELSRDLMGTAYGTLSALFACALEGDRDGVLRHLTPELVQFAAFVEFFSLTIAESHALVGERDEAMHWLRKAVSQGFINHAYLARLNRHFDPLRSEAEFQSLMEDVRMRWESLKPIVA